MSKLQISHKKTTILFLTLFAFLVFFSIIDPNNTNSTQINISNTSGPLIGPLTITDNAGLASIASAGDGTAQNPYELRDFTVNVSQLTSRGLWIIGTTANFVIRNCTFIGNSHDASLAISSIADGTAVVENCSFIGGDVGIFIYESNEIKIVNNQLFDSPSFAVIVSISNFCTVESNNFMDEKACVYLFKSNQTKIITNSFSNATDNSINLEQSHDCFIKNNIINNSNWGIAISFSVNTTVIGNVINGTHTGIGISYALGFHIINNTVMDQERGMALTGTWDFHIFNNTFHMNQNGLLFDSSASHHGLIYENIFRHSTIGPGIKILSPTHNHTIFHNVFDQNSGSQAYDEGADNVWYKADIMEGNAWSDWSGSGSYTISGSAGSVDIYPNVTTSAFLDSDNDGLTDDSEIYTFSTEWNNNDTDLDGLLDGEEIFQYLTNPFRNDTDGDLMPDGWEVDYGLNPLVNDALVDSDQDGVSNLDEFNNDIDPTNEDSDEDGVFDGWELEYGYNPLVNDSSDDSDSDGASLLDEFTYDCDPTMNDTDMDGLLDGEEIHTFHTDPTYPDTDGDGFSDGEEVEKGSDPLDSEDIPRTIPGYSTRLIVMFGFAALVLIYHKIKKK